jgi:hypothetical protein
MNPYLNRHVSSRGRRLLRAFCCAGCGALLVSGCATIRRAREAQDAARIPPGERTVTAAEAGLSSNSVLTLDGALDIASRWISATRRSS